MQTNKHTIMSVHHVCQSCSERRSWRNVDDDPFNCSLFLRIPTTNRLTGFDRSSVGACHGQKTDALRKSYDSWKLSLATSMSGVAAPWRAIATIHHSRTKRTHSLALLCFLSWCPRTIRDRSARRIAEGRRSGSSFKPTYLLQVTEVRDSEYFLPFSLEFVHVFKINK